MLMLINNREPLFYDFVNCLKPRHPFQRRFFRVKFIKIPLRLFKSCELNQIYSFCCLFEYHHLRNT